jgi:outer membrane murein-binding lipoprotein Lpp
MELMVAITIFSIVVAGCLSSSLLFAKIANNHGNVAGFRNDLRFGFEDMASDVRNAKSISTRTNRMFTLTYSDNPDITYTYNATSKIVYRQESGSSRKAILHNVTAFDVLTSQSDSDDAMLTYDEDQLSLEEIQMSAPNGSGPESMIQLTNFTLKLRNS